MRSLVLVGVNRGKECGNVYVWDRRRSPPAPAGLAASSLPAATHKYRRGASLYVGHERCIFGHGRRPTCARRNACNGFAAPSPPQTDTGGRGLFPFGHEKCLFRQGMRPTCARRSACNEFAAPSLPAATNAFAAALETTGGGAGAGEAPAPSMGGKVGEASPPSGGGVAEMGSGAMEATPHCGAPAIAAFSASRTLDEPPPAATRTDTKAYDTRCAASGICETGGR
jgi:hypothetical protein